MSQLKVGDRVFYVGTKYPHLHQYSLTVHSFDASWGAPCPNCLYYPADRPDGALTTWLDEDDLVLDERE